MFLSNGIMLFKGVLRSREMKVRQIGKRTKITSTTLGQLMCP